MSEVEKLARKGNFVANILFMLYSLRFIAVVLVILYYGVPMFLIATGIWEIPCNAAVSNCYQPPLKGLFR